MSLIRQALDAHLSVLNRKDQVEFKDKIGKMTEPQRANLALEIMKQHPQFRSQVAKLQVGGIIPMPGKEAPVQINSTYKEKPVTSKKVDIPVQEPVQPKRPTPPVEPVVQPSPYVDLLTLSNPNIQERLRDNVFRVPTKDTREEIKEFTIPQSEAGEEVHKHPNGLVSMTKQTPKGYQYHILNHDTGQWEPTDPKKRWSAIEEEANQTGWPYTGDKIVASKMSDLPMPSMSDITPQDQNYNNPGDFVTETKKVANPILQPELGYKTFSDEELNAMKGNKPPVMKLKDGIETTYRNLRGTKVHFIKNHNTGEWEELDVKRIKDIEKAGLDKRWPYTATLDELSKASEQAYIESRKRIEPLTEGGDLLPQAAKDFYSGLREKIDRENNSLTSRQLADNYDKINQPPTQVGGIEMLKGFRGSNEDVYLKNHETGKWERQSEDWETSRKSAKKKGWPYVIPQKVMGSKSYTGEQLQAMLDSHRWEGGYGKGFIVGKMNGKTVRFMHDKETNEYIPQMKKGGLTFKNYKKGGIV